MVSQSWYLNRWFGGCQSRLDRLVLAPIFFFFFPFLEVTCKRVLLVFSFGIGKTCVFFFFFSSSLAISRVPPSWLADCFFLLTHTHTHTHRWLWICFLRIKEIITVGKERNNVMEQSWRQRKGEVGEPLKIGLSSSCLEPRISSTARDTRDNFRVLFFSQMVHFFPSLPQKRNKK